MSVQNNKIFKKNRNFPWQTIESETIIIDPQGKNSFELNELGSLIWNNFDGKKTLFEINEIILEQFDEDPEKIDHDLHSFINHLNENQLIEEVT